MYGVMQGFVEGVGADSDRRPAEVVLADVHGVERRVPGLLALREDLGLGDRRVVQREVRDVGLAVHHVLDALELLVLGVDREEDVVLSACDLAEGRDECRPVGVADVVLLAPRPVAAVGLGHQLHLGRVDVGAVGALGEPEREDPAVLEQARRALLDRLVAAHPDRSEPEHRDLPGVPVGEAVEAEDLGELAVAPGVPAAIGAAVAGGREQGREDPVRFHELEEIGVPDPIAIVFLEPTFPLLLEERDGLSHHLPGAFIRVLPVVVFRVE